MLEGYSGNYGKFLPLRSLKSDGKGEINSSPTMQDINLTEEV